MMFAPLGEPATLAVEILEEYRHAHGDVLHGEAATVLVRVTANTVRNIHMDDENGGFMATRLGKLRHISDIDQTLPQRFFRNVAMRGRKFQISAKKGKDVRVVILDGLSA
jgi:hypothetical protein